MACKQVDLGFLLDGGVRTELALPVHTSPPLQASRPPIFAAEEAGRPSAATRTELRRCTSGTMPSNMNYRPLTKPRPAGRGAQESLSSPTVQRAGRVLFFFSCLWIFVCVLSSLGGAGYAARKLPSFRKSLFSSAYSRPDPTSFCDPYALPGFISALAGTAQGTQSPLGVWRTFDSSCQSSAFLPALLSTLPKSPYQASISTVGSTRELDGLIGNKTILLVGDMVDKSLVESFCLLAGETAHPVDGFHPWGSAALSAAHKEPHAQSTHQIAHYCYLPTYDFLLMSVYHYGIDVTDAWKKLPLYQGPGLFEDRVDELILPLLKAAADPALASSSLPAPRRSHVPDLVAFQTSFWDLALWAQQDVDAGRAAVADLTEERLLAWRSRAVDMLSHLADRKVFGPETPLLWRSTHYPTDDAGATVEWFTGQEGADPAAAAAGRKNHPLFHLNRIQQLNHAQLSTVMPSGDDVVRGSRARLATLPASTAFAPWGQLMLGQDHRQSDQISPSANPGASVFAEMLLWNLDVYRTLDKW